MPLSGVSSIRLGVFLLAAALAASSCSSGSGGGTSTTTVAAAATAPTASTIATQPGPLGPEGVPIPAGPVVGPVDTSAYPKTIDGVPCEVSEQLVYHIHAHLTVFVNGQPRQVPYGIGIASPVHTTTTPEGDFVDGGSCFYWLHTHAADGILHIESPTQKLYTLGQFFDVWGQPLTTDRVGPATGSLTVFVNGQPYTGNPRDIALSRYLEVQIDVGAVVAPLRIDWTTTRL